MKKILLTGTLLIMLSALFAQDPKKLKTYLDAKQYDKAKAEVDAAIAKNATSPLTLYYKSRVYAALASDPQFKASVPDAREQAFEAFKKAIETDKDNKVLFAATQDQYKPIFDLYTGYYDAGAAAFNNGAASRNKADYDQALSMFKNSDMVGRYIYSKKWALSELDTQLVLTIGKAAINADKKEEALQYLKRLADAGIFATKDDNTGYQLPYQWLSLYYKDAKDEENFLKYNSLGRKLFPKEDYYDAVMLDYYREKKNYPSLFRKYDEITTNFPDSFSYHFNYAADVFNFIYNKDASKIDNKELLLKSVGVELQKAITLSPNDVGTKLLLGQYYYNQGVDLREAANLIKGTKPEDVKKRADLTLVAKDLFNKSIPFTEDALKTLENNGYKKNDKSKYKSTVNLMQGIYQYLNQPDKVKFYQAKYDSADSKFIK
ncbi:MAG TPA: hypothetical protein VGP43_03670 [Chitinophagaceae bacterium]|nr:hypothetical protein [Chitinophagaceae bacterium]